MNEQTQETLRDYYFQNVADSDAGFGTLEMSVRFGDILAELGCQETMNSEWDFYCPHNGISAEIIPGKHFVLRSSDELNLDSYADWEDAFRKAWDSHYHRLAMLEASLEHYEAKTADVSGFWYEDCTKKERAALDRHEIVLDAYDEEIEQALKDICEAFEQSLRDIYNWCYSDEAADEWIKCEGDYWLEENYLEKQVA
jgi:hypothetical protein